jgi:superoxide dismutase, Cu-Zn family
VSQSFGRKESKKPQSSRNIRDKLAIVIATAMCPCYLEGRSKKRGIVVVKNILFGVGLTALVGCSLASPESRATAELKDKDGKTVGRAVFREQADGVLVRMEVSGLTPGVHAVHVHAVGKCEGPAFTTAGGHFNPAGKKHGVKSPAGPHAGDLPNMAVAKDGSGRFEAKTDGITLKPGATSIFDKDGSALIIHAAADDYVTDPTGNAGDRIACGLIVAGS